MKKNILIIAILAVLGLIYRLVDLPPNFAPVGAIALFSGYYFRRQWAILVPLFIMLISDFIIGFYNFQIMMSVYFSFAMVAGVGYALRNKKFLTRIAIGPAVSAILFYLITNFAVWKFGVWYPATWEGLMQSYLMGLPFLRNTFLGDLTFTLAIFGVYEAIVLFNDSKIERLNDSKI